MDTRSKGGFRGIAQGAENDRFRQVFATRAEKVATRRQSCTRSRRADVGRVVFMASLVYGDSANPIHIEDRALAHLKIVIATKLRRNESFTLSWTHPEGDPAGRSTIWIHPSIPLRFIFDEAEPPQISLKWIEQLMHTASSSGGIVLVDEMLDSPELDSVGD